MIDKFRKLFNDKKSLIGMIHLAGKSRKEKVRRAIEELKIYKGEGID